MRAPRDGAAAAEERCMMAYRYELVDTVHPSWRGGRFTSLRHALRELAAAFPPGRFVLIDRTTGEEVRPDA